MSTYHAISDRSESPKLTRIASLVLAGNLAGFLTASYLPGALGVDHQIVTIPFRAVMLFLLLYAFYRIVTVSKLRMTISSTSILLIFFWTAYCLRFIFDVGFLQIPVPTPPGPGEMALYLFAITIPTFVVSYLFRDIRSYKKALIWVMLALGICCGISMRTASSLESPSTGGRNMGNDILNHIGYGHMGTTAMILGLFVLLQIGSVRRPWYLRLLGGVIVCLGTYTILAAASRGALVAALLLVPVALYLGLRRGSKGLTIAICLVIGFVLSASAAFLTENGVDLTRSVASASAYSAADNSVWTRQNLFRDAWREYLEHPWVGSSLVETNSQTYPHNIIIEGFMTMGTFGGATLVVLILISLWRAMWILIKAPEMAWIPLCFLQHLIGCMFSGGIWGNTVMWGMMGIVLGVDLPERIWNNSKDEIRFIRDV